MKDPVSASEQKYDAIVKYAPVPLAEIEQDGRIIRLNVMGQKLLKPLFHAYQLNEGNIYPLLHQIFPEIVEKIKNFTAPKGRITYNLIKVFKQPTPNGTIEKHFQYNINKIFEGCIMVGVEDLTNKYLEEKYIQQKDLENAVARGKFEIASEVLHDIGNALVGFNSYLTRIQRSLQPDPLSNLQTVISFLAEHHETLADAIGDSKADALIVLLKGIKRTESQYKDDIKNAVAEQQHIVDHIEGILNIHREQLSGFKVKERKLVNLKDIIQDCCAMLQASYEKKGITVSHIISDTIPLIRGDRTKLMQAILNILKNSIEAIEEEMCKKTITIELATKRKKLQLTIKDTGKGFTKETADKLFERRYTTKYLGTGIGLYNCKNIIESHAGTISIKSKGINLGATAVIRFNY